MKRRRLTSSIVACFNLTTRQSGSALKRRNRPRLDHLEPRCLLATVTEFRVPSGTGAAPDGMTAGPGDSVWFTEFGADKIGTIDTVTHAISEFSIPTPNAQPFRIVMGPDGSLWFTEFNVGQIGRIDPTTDKITEYPLSSASAMPFGITAGPHDTVWFTEWTGNAIGSIDIHSGKVTEYSIPTANSVPEGITLGSDGNIYFTESQAGQIAKFDPTSHEFTEYPLPAAGAQPYGITTGPGGNLYFTEYASNQIGVFRVNDSSFMNPIKMPASNTQPTEIASDGLGQLWVTQSKTNQVAMLNPVTGSFKEYATPAAVSGPRGIAAASDGSIWFSEVNSGRVATIAPALQLVVTASPPLNVNLGETFGLTVAVEFASNGAVDTGYNGSVNLALLGATAASTASLAGTTTLSAKNGIVSFNGLSITQPGRFSLQVRSGDATPATIGPIDVIATPGGPTPVLPVGPRTVTPPIVLGERLVFAGKRNARYVAGVVLTFSSALDPETAQNSSNYTVIQTSKAGRARAIKPVRLHATYKPAGHAVKLTFSGKPRFTTGGQLVLTGSGPNGIASSLGVLLGGNRGNQPGANAVFTILPMGHGITG